MVLPLLPLPLLQLQRKAGVCTASDNVRTSAYNTLERRAVAKLGKDGTKRCQPPNKPKNKASVYGSVPVLPAVDSGAEGAAAAVVVAVAVEPSSPPSAPPAASLAASSVVASSSTWSAATCSLQRAMTGMISFSSFTHLLPFMMRTQVALSPRHRRRQLHIILISKRSGLS